MVLMNLFSGQAHIENGLVDTAGEGEGGKNREGNIGIYTLPCVKQIVSEKLYNTGISATAL